MLRMLCVGKKMREEKKILRGREKMGKEIKTGSFVLFFFFKQEVLEGQHHRVLFTVDGK